MLSTGGYGADGGVWLLPLAREVDGRRTGLELGSQYFSGPGPSRNTGMFVGPRVVYIDPALVICDPVGGALVEVLTDAEVDREDVEERRGAPR